MMNLGEMMNIFTIMGHIFINSMVPIFMLISMGIVLDKKFKLDLYTLSKLNFYILLPAFVFRSLYEAHFTWSTLEIVLCAVTVLIINYIMSSAVGKWQDYDIAKTATLKNCVMFNNCGNMGVALALFVFSNVPYIIDGKTPYADLGMLSVVSIMVIQTITSNTFGFYQAGAGRLSARDALRVVFHMPMVYAVPIALLAKLLPYDLHNLFAYAPLSIFANAFVGVAMLALGVQINRTPLNFFKGDVMLAAVLRLVASPILAAGVTLLFINFYSPMHPIAAQTIIITYSVPSAINMALIAIEMKNNPEYATQIVMGSTILSAITMPIFITMAYYLFPI